MGVNNGLKAMLHIEKSHVETIVNSRVNIQDLKAALAAYCEVSQHNIEQIYKGYSLPSLPLALKMAKYFRVNVEDIFSLSTEEDN